MSRTITLRLPPDVYDNISASAATLSRTKNKEIVERLSSTFHRERLISSILLDGLGLEKHQRIVSSTEEADIRRLFLFVENLDIDAIYMAARRDPERGRALVIILKSYSISYLLDHTTLNPAHSGSKELILDFVANIERLGLMDCLHLADECVDDTRSMSPFDAIALILATKFQRTDQLDRLFGVFDAR